MPARLCAPLLICGVFKSVSNRFQIGSKSAFNALCAQVLRRPRRLPRHQATRSATRPHPLCFPAIHRVLFSGYGASDKGEKYWIVQNSWGPSWGMQGTFMIRRGTNECGIEVRALRRCRPLSLSRTVLTMLRSARRPRSWLSPCRRARRFGLTITPRHRERGLQRLFSKASNRFCIR